MTEPLANQLNELHIDPTVLVVHVDSGPQQGTKLECDLFLCSLIIDEVTRRHKSSIVMSEEEASQQTNYEAGRVYYRTTVAFLQDLSDEFAKAFNYCIPSMAHAMWLRCLQLEEEIKKKSGSTSS